MKRFFLLLPLLSFSCHAFELCPEGDTEYFISERRPVFYQAQELFKIIKETCSEITDSSTNQMKLVCNFSESAKEYQPYPEYGLFMGFDKNIKIYSPWKTFSIDFQEPFEKIWILSLIGALLFKGVILKDASDLKEIDKQAGRHRLPPNMYAIKHVTKDISSITEYFKNRNCFTGIEEIRIACCNPAQWNKLLREYKSLTEQ